MVPRSVVTAVMVVLTVTIFSCAGAPSRRPEPGGLAVYLTNENRFLLAPPSGMEGDLDMLQRIEGSYGDENVAILSYVIADETTVEMVFMNDLGTEIGSLRYDAAGLDFSGLLASQGLSAEYILADFQLTYYRERVISDAIRSAGLAMEVNADSGGEIRTITDGDDAVISIEKRSGGVTFTNHLRGYTYEIFYEG